MCHALIGTLYPIRHLVPTVTSDNGKEFADHELVSITCEADFYFAKPYSSWQRGSNENANGLVRQYLPKGTDFATFSDEQIAEIERRINSRPRKTLAYRTLTKSSVRLSTPVLRFRVESTVPNKPHHYRPAQSFQPECTQPSTGRC